MPGAPVHIFTPRGVVTGSLEECARIVAADPNCGTGFERQRFSGRCSCQPREDATCRGVRMGAGVDRFELTRVYTCTTNTSVPGTPDVKLSTGLSSDVGYTKDACMRECDANADCQTFVFSKYANNRCELWSSEHASTWSVHSHTYASGFASFHSAAYTLTDAKHKCATMGTACKAVTCTPQGACTVRKSATPAPSSSGETTHVRVRGARTAVAAGCGTITDKAACCHFDDGRAEFRTAPDCIPGNFADGSTCMAALEAALSYQQNRSDTACVQGGVADPGTQLCTKPTPMRQSVVKDSNSSTTNSTSIPAHGDAARSVNGTCNRAAACSWFAKAAKQGHAHAMLFVVSRSPLVLPRLASGLRCDTCHVC